ncbi:MAG: FkbM family methyltransferase [Pseudomonadota bacterium]
MNLSAIQSSIRGLLGDRRFVGIDIGARFDIPPPWLPLDGIAHIVSFEPDAEACTRLKHTYDQRGNGHMYTVRPVAVTRDGGDRTLYVTNAPSGSSMFNPDTPLLQQYVNDSYLYPIKTITVPTEPIRRELDQLGETDPDLMKLDIQGCELEVLEGLGEDVLGNVLCIETEAAMRDRGEGYPTFHDLHSFLSNAGFELVNIWPVTTHRTKNGERHNYLSGDLGVRTTSPSVEARAWEADVLYVRSFDALYESGNVDKLVKLAICLCIYGYYIEALYAIEQAGEKGLLDASTVTSHCHHIREWHSNAYYKPWHADTTFGNLVRRVLKKFNLTNLETPLVNVHRR